MTPSTAEPTHTAPAPTTALVRPAEPTGPSAHFFSRRPHPTAGIPPRPTRRRAPPSVLRLLLALLLAPASSALAAAAAPIPPALHNLHLHTAPNPALDAARQLYAEGRYADAASAFEQIYRTTGDTAALFNAGMAREAAGAGHETHAIYDWLRYLELTPSAAEEERLDLQRRIAAAQAHTTPVELLYNAAPDGPEPTHIKLFFTAKGSPGPAATDPLIFQILPDSYSKTPVIRAHLALGDWTAESYSGAQRLHEQPFTLTEQTTTPQLIPIAPPQPQPNPDPDPIDPPTPKPPVKKQKEPRLRLALTLTTGLTSAALLGTGLGLTLHGYNEFKEHTGDLNNPDRINAVDRLLTDTRTYWTGIGLLGGGLGSGLVAIGEAATPPPPPPRSPHHGVRARRSPHRRQRHRHPSPQTR
jgi:hypothetical protein